MPTTITINTVQANTLRLTITHPTENPTVSNNTSETVITVPRKYNITPPLPVGSNTFNNCKVNLNGSDFSGPTDTVVVNCQMNFVEIYVR